MSAYLKRPWVAHERIRYPADEPSVFDPADHTWVRHVELHWTEIRDELRSVLAREHEALSPYPDPEMTSRPRAWRTAGLMYWTFPSRRYQAMFPRTWEVLRGVPDLTSASFLLLEPNSTIRPHIGDTNAVYRCHLGLIVPAAAPRCGFRVKEHVLDWVEGKVLIFNDAHEHTAWNNTDQPRYILSFDVMRPEFLGMERSVACRVLGNIYCDILSQRYALVRRLERTPRMESAMRSASKAWFSLLNAAGLPLFRFF